MKKFGSSIERVEGVREKKEEREIFSEFRERFDDQEFHDFKDKEREKTPEELQIISLVNEITNEARRRFGLEDFNVPEKNIHIIKEEKWTDRKSGTRAIHDVLDQLIELEERPTKMSFAHLILHEILHLKSYQAAQKVQEKTLGVYRTGLRVVSRQKNKKGIFLENLNEATTEILTRQLFHDLAQNPIFQEEIKFIKRNAVDKDDKIIKWDILDYGVISLWKDKDGNNIIERSGYEKERKNLYLLMNKIFERNSDKFEEKIEVFDIFAKAMLDGNIMPLGRLLEKTFGRKDRRFILSKLAEVDSDVEKQREFIESL